MRPVTGNHLAHDLVIVARQRRRGLTSRGVYRPDHRRLGIATDSDQRIADLVAERTAEARDEIVRLELPEPVVMSAGTIAEAAEAVASFHREGVTGVIAHNDDVAARIISATFSAGRTIPTDLAIIGHDDSPLAGLLFPPLTSVRIDAAEGGRMLAAGVLGTLTETPLTSELARATTAEVIRREST